MPRWSLLESAPDDIRQALAGYPKIVADLLHRRGITTAAEATAFLNPDFKTGVHDPAQFRHMPAACERLFSALQNNEAILVHGDYDADGLCGSALLTGVFHQLLAAMGKGTESIKSFHPHREKDGYGIRIPTIERFATDGTKLMVTVDCGISCATEIARAKELGMDTIVVDHHEFDANNLPQCIVLHPRLPDETYPFKFLAAVGVAYKFACGLYAHARCAGLKIDDGAEKWLLDLVSIATVTDVMPLVGENRVLEKFGLIVLNKTRRPGLRKIIEGAGLTWGKLDTVSVGFMIGPRLNAASRMEHASSAFVALMADNDADATKHAEHLNQLNQDRQKYTEQVYKEAKAQALATPNAQVFVIKGEGWLAGIVGLIAGKLTSEFGRPAFVFGQEGDKLVGSGRGAAPYNVVTAMERAKEHLLRFGGHPQACGLTIIGDDNFLAFKAVAEAYAAEIMGDQVPGPEHAIDGELQVSEVTPEFVDAVLSLEPYGEKNPRPKFALRNLVITGINYVGKTKNHVQLLAKGDSPKELKMIGFNFADSVADLSIRSRIDVIVEVGINEWNGMRQPEFRLIDLKPAGTADTPTEKIPEAEVVAENFEPEPEYARPMYVI